jgi:F0F1-type ATP synthase delta subunit
MEARTVHEEIIMPLLLVGPVEVGRLIRELLVVDNLIAEAKLKGKLDDFKTPTTSTIMDQLIRDNKLDIIKNSDRKFLFDSLKHIGLKSPVLHISLSADPTPAFTEKLMAWLRKELHPQILVTIGLQPSIGAGCIVRSTNKYFDLSLRKDLLAKNDLLLSKINAMEAVNG